MATPVDNTPLWGSAQLNYPDFNQPGPSTAWSDGAVYSNVQHPYDQYAGMREEINYTELKTDYPVPMSDTGPGIPNGYPRAYAQQQQQHHVQAPMAGLAPPVPHGGYVPGMLPSSPFINSNNVLLSEHPTYLPPMSSFRHMSPDAGYSSPGSVSSDYYAQQLQSGHTTPEYSSMMSPYHGVMPSEEPLEMEIPVKEEYQEMQPVSYTKELESIVNHVDESKPIIHENIQICPPLKLEQLQVMQNYVPPQQEQAFQLNFAPTQEPQKEPVQIIESDQYETISLDDEPVEETSASSSVEITPAEQSMGESAETPPQSATSPTQSAKAKYVRKDAASMALIDPADRRSARPSAIKESDFPCNLCGQFFARQCGLSQHKRWIHTPRIHACVICGKLFHTVAQLNTHFARHNEQNKKFKCDQCPKQFCHANDLRRHRFRHSDTSPFVCTECGSGFVRNDHLVAHQASHERRRLAAEKKAAKKLQKKKNGKKQQQEEQEEEEEQDEQNSSSDTEENSISDAEMTD